MEEYLDIVDENNNLTGKKELRSKVHSEGLWHRTIHVYLFRKNNNKIEFLVHLRSKFKDLNPDKWDTRFGGHIKAGTSFEEAIDSELHEEAGIKIDQNQLIKGEPVKRDKFPNREFTQPYFFEYAGEIEDLQFNDGEVQAVKWMNIQEIKDSMKNNSEIWSASLQRFEKISEFLMEKLK